MVPLHPLCKELVSIYKHISTDSFPLRVVGIPISNIFRVTDISFSDPD